MKTYCALWLAATVLVGLALMPRGACGANYNSYAIVKDDGSLRVKGRTIWLDGVRIPPTYQSCLTFMRPVRCGPRAILMMELKIEPHFVHCHEVSVNPDRSINAVCEVEGEDLAAYMLRNGWAEALADAPPEYHELQASARAKYLGIWALVPGDMSIRPSPGDN